MPPRDLRDGSLWKTDPGRPAAARAITSPAAERPPAPDPAPPRITLTTTPGAASQLIRLEEEEPPPGWEEAETRNHTAVALVEEPWELAEEELATDRIPRLPLDRQTLPQRAAVVGAPDRSPLYWRTHGLLLVFAAGALLLSGARPDGLAWAGVLVAGGLGYALSRLAQGPAILLHAALVLGIGAVWLHADGNLAERWALGGLAPVALAVLPCFWLAALEGAAGALAGLLLSVAALPVTGTDRILVAIVGFVAASVGFVAGGSRR